MYVAEVTDTSYAGLRTRELRQSPDKTAPMPSLPPPSVAAISINNSSRDIEKGTSANSEAVSKAAMGNAAASDGVTPLETISVPVVAVPKKPSGLKGWGRLKVSIILYLCTLKYLINVGSLINVGM